MKKQLLLLFIFILYFSINGYSQECGGGTVALKIYTINGLNIKEFNYEVLPVSEKLLREEFLEKVSGSKEVVNNMENDIFKSGHVVNEYFSEKIIDFGVTLNEDLKGLIKSDINKLGKVKSCLNFKTLELRRFLVLVRIKANNKTVYIVGNFFGGCDREVSLIWDNQLGKLN